MKDWKDSVSDALNSSDDGDNNSGGKDKSKKKNKGSGKDKTTKSSAEKNKEKRQNLRKKKSGSATEDIIETMGIVYAIPHLLKDNVENLDINGKQKKIARDTARKTASEARNQAGIWAVNDISNDYGYAWTEVVNGSMQGGYSDEMSKSDMKDSLKFIANVLMHAHGARLTIEEKMEKNKTDKLKAQYVMAKTMEERIDEAISGNNIQRHAEAHGMDFMDIVQWVMSEQDNEEMVYGT